MKSSYEILQPPFRAIFGSMSRAEVHQYFEWFTEQIPYRVSLLRSFIQSDAEFSDFSADYQPQALIPLGKWFYKQVKSRKRSDREKESAYSHAPNWLRNFEIPDDDLSLTTFSLSVDIGMYFGQTMIENNPFMKWQPLMKPKNIVDYQQPVIYGKGTFYINPVHIMVTYAYGVLQETKGPERLLELYEIWVGLLSN